MSASELKQRHKQAGGDSFAWKRAAAILKAKREGASLPPVVWPELWDILRWYAHNRGYDGNSRWARASEETSGLESDSEKEQTARALMNEYKATTMAETIAAYTEHYEREVALWVQEQRKDKIRHFKGLGAAFPREIVIAEVRSILEALKGKLPHVDDTLIRCLLSDGNADVVAWSVIPVQGLQLPKRYQGGLLFGQLVPRFDNRIIGQCPIWYARRAAEMKAAGISEGHALRRAAIEAKLPSKNSPEFLRFRWAMQLANLFGVRPGQTESQPMTAEHRRKLTILAEQQGAFSAGEFKKTVRSITGWTRDNLDQTLLHPDAENALILDPVQRAIRNSPLKEIWPELPPIIQKRLRGKLRRARSVKIGTVRQWAGEMPSFDAILHHHIDRTNTKKGRGKELLTLDALLETEIRIEFPTGRAPYARPVLRQTIDEILNPSDPLSPRHPRESGGCLEQTEHLREAQLCRRLEDQTNNHLVRHRLLILERLLNDLISAPEFASNDKRRISSLTIEVNRDLRNLAGKTAKEIAQDLGIRLGDFKRVAANVEAECQRRGIQITAGLIRKARIAEDLRWTCPYTGQKYELAALIDGAVDKDHVIPHADRQSDSLDSLVITYSAVNKWKGRRTALQFITEEGGKPVPGQPSLSVLPLERYKSFVEALDIRNGHDDDKQRKKRRKQRLLLAVYEEKDFTPRDLTVTSHLVRLGAQVLQRHFLDLPRDERPPTVSIPGSVTAEVRKAWNLLGCLATASPQTAGKTKTEIRGVTHLHHALDACVLGLATHFFPRHGSLWAAMVKAGKVNAEEGPTLWRAMVQRRPSTQEQALLRGTGLYRADPEGRMRLGDLDNSVKDEIRLRLAEKRVVQHLPADMSGVKIEENTRGIAGMDGDRVLLRQLAPRDAKSGIRLAAKKTPERPEKLLGFKPGGGIGKLQKQAGVRVITDNFGVAILDFASDPEERFAIVPWHRVWHRLRELRVKNQGRRVTLIRNGNLIRIRAGNFAGIWRVFSAKNNSSGMALDIGWPDVVRLQNKTEGHKINVLLASLVKGGLEVIPSNLVGTSSS